MGKSSVNRKADPATELHDLANLPVRLGVDLAAPGMSLENGWDGPVGRPADLADAAIRAGGQVFSLADLATCMPANGAAADPAVAAEVALGAGQFRQAAATFALALGPQAGRVAAAYGLALSLASEGDHAGSLGVLRVLDAAGVEHPACLALAGFSAFKVGENTEARQFLARAARRARVGEEFRGILKFSQHTLLIQQFGGR